MSEARPIRVLLAAPPANRLVGGGAAVQLAQTARHLPEYGVEVGYFDPWRRYAPDDADLVHIFGAYMATYDLADRLADLGWPLAVSTIFFTRRSPRFVRTVRRFEALSKRFVGGIWTDYGVASRICARAAAVLPNTSEEAHLVEAGFGVPGERITIIPNGVEDHFQTATPDLFRETYGLEDIILCVANIGSVRKNVLGLIEALAEIDHPAVIIGKVFDNEYARRCLAAAERNPRLRIIDGLPHDSPLLASAYAASAVFALPAFFETPGIAALEAALAGARVVITPHGGTRDYFRDQAVYAEPTSVTAIRDAIREALATREDNGLRERVWREYRWTRVAERTAAVYRRIVDGGDSR